MFINKRMNKQIVVYLYNGISLNPKRKETTGMPNSMDKHLRYNVGIKQGNYKKSTHDNLIYDTWKEAKLIDCNKSC